MPKYHPINNCTTNRNIKWKDTKDMQENLPRAENIPGKYVREYAMCF
jgi:hypothetical protein